VVRFRCCAAAGKFGLNAGGGGRVAIFWKADSKRIGFVSGRVELISVLTILAVA